MKTKSTFEKSSKKKKQKTSNSLIVVKPGKYMMLDKNEMKRIELETQGLNLGERIENDNHYLVLVDNQIILVPTLLS